MRLGFYKDASLIGHGGKTTFSLIAFFSKFLSLVSLVLDILSSFSPSPKIACINLWRKRGFKHQDSTYVRHSLTYLPTYL